MSHYAGPTSRRLKFVGINLHAIADASSFTGLPARFRVTKMTITNASATPILATIGLYDTAAAGGVEIVTPATITALSAATKLVDASFASTDVVTTGALYLRCSVANAAALTADVYIDYQDMT